MDTCIICHNAYDPIWDEFGNELLNPNTQICVKCERKIKNKEIEITEDLEKILKYVEGYEKDENGNWHWNNSFK